MHIIAFAENNKEKTRLKGTGGEIPVLASPMRSLPERIAGMACFCMGVGSSNCWRAISFITSLSNDTKCSKPLAGRGASSPDTLISLIIIEREERERERETVSYQQSQYNDEYFVLSCLGWWRQQP